MILNLHCHCTRRLERELRKDREDFLEMLNDYDLQTAHHEALEAADEGEVSLWYMPCLFMIPLLAGDL